MPELLYDGEFAYPRGQHRRDRVESVCYLRLWRVERRMDPDLHIVVATEVDHNPGPSITNSASALGTAIMRHFGLREAPHVRFYELYPGAPRSFTRLLFNLYDPRAVELGSPYWEPAELEGVERLVGEAIVRWEASA